MPIQFPQQFNILPNIKLSNYNTIKVGGNARYFTVVKDQSILVDLYRFAFLEKIRFLALGHGTNVFFSKEGFNGLVAVLDFKNIFYEEKNFITIQAGAALKDLNETCLKHALAGCEFTSGIPGTVGGAIYGNAGAYGNSIADRLWEATILTIDGHVKKVDNSYFKFDYRYSALKKNPAIVLDATFKFQHGDQQEIKSKIDNILTKRRKKLPSHTVPTAGSYFKNILKSDGTKEAAALYLDQIGSKTICVGDAAVHHKHANIFYNKGNTTAEELLELEKILQEKVYNQFGIRLEREVMFIE